MRVWWWVWFGMVGCEADPPKGTPSDSGTTPAPTSDWVPFSLSDQGEVCLERTGTELTVYVIGDPCLSGSCSRNRTGTCTATVDKSGLSLTSAVSWEELTGKKIDCTDDCNAAAAVCTAPIDSAVASLMVTHGASQEELTIGKTGSCQIYLY